MDITTGLIKGRAPAVPAVWPWGEWIAVGLGVLAVMVVCWIVLDLFIRYVLHPFFMAVLGDKKSSSRTPKAKEKFADSLMSVSNAVHSATWISLLVFPLTAFIQSMAGGTDPVAKLVDWWRPDRWSWWHTGMFITLFLLPLHRARSMQLQALDLYDEVSGTSSPPGESGSDMSEFSASIDDQHERPLL